MHLTWGHPSPSAEMKVFSKGVPKPLSGNIFAYCTSSSSWAPRTSSSVSKISKASAIMSTTAARVVAGQILNADAALGFLAFKNPITRQSWRVIWVETWEGESLLFCCAFCEDMVILPSCWKTSKILARMKWIFNLLIILWALSSCGLFVKEDIRPCSEHQSSPSTYFSLK